MSFFAVIAVLLTLALPQPAEHARDEKLFHSIAEGFRFVRREPGLRINALAMSVNTFLAAPFIALVPAMAEKVLHTDIGTSILIAVQGTGAVLMAFSLGWLVQRYGPRRLLVGLMGALPVALAAYAYAPDLALSALAIFFAGALYLGALSSFSTVAQLRAPAAIRGRVLAVNTMILGSLYPLGAVLQGKIADGIGLRATTFGAAADHGRGPRRRAGLPTGDHERPRPRAGSRRPEVGSPPWQWWNSNDAGRSHSSPSTGPKRATQSVPR